MATEVSRERLYGLTAALVLLWLLWNTPVVYPVRILVTFIHEISHGLAAVLTGGSIAKITVSANGSGVCWTAGGWRIFVIPAGYLGSMVWGSLILVLACRTRWDRAISLVLGCGLLLVTALYVRSVFGFASGLVLGTALAASGRFLSESANDTLLTFLGTASCLYALFDIRTLMKSGCGGSDAARFSSEIFPLPASVWAGLWGVLALVWLALALRLALQRPR